MTANTRYILGLDIGSNSIGWAALKLNAEGQPVGFLEPGTPANVTGRDRVAPSCGSRIFEEGVENYGQGDKEQPRNATRRAARQMRRQIQRRQRRQRSTFVTLQHAGLLPLCEGGAKADSVNRKLVLDKLDSDIRATHTGARIERLPYFLRARGLDVELTPVEFGRAIYSLAQKRGFKSNRKADGATKADEKSVVNGSISGLQSEMLKLGHRTLGEHLNALPQGANLRNKGEKKDGQKVTRKALHNRYTNRAMYEAEFEKLWTKQVEFHPEYATAKAVIVSTRPDSKGGRKHVEKAASLKDALWHTLFFQRPLKSVEGLVGDCELESGREYHDENGEIFTTEKCRRSPKYRPTFQQFRSQSAISNLKIVSQNHDERFLCSEEQQKLAAKCELVEVLTWAAIRTALGLPKDTRFNLELTGKNGIPGNKPSAKLKEVFSERWTNLDSSTRNSLICDLATSDLDAEVIAQHVTEGRGAWKKLSPTTTEAEAVSKLTFEPGYANLSARAMSKLLTQMKTTGEPVGVAQGRLYGEVAVAPCDLLPPVIKSLGDLRNPVVSRVLTQLRLVVNSIVKRYGKPESIRVELARDIKKSKKDRGQIEWDNRKREKDRAEALAEVLKLGGNERDDVEKYLLAKEMDFTCPYSGTRYGIQGLINSTEVDHILPFSWSLDNSFQNKVVCLTEKNREKSNRTPFEAFGNDDVEAWKTGEIVARIVSTKNRGKIKKFVTTSRAELELGFRSRQLNDTRYASRIAVRYLTSLYGGKLATGTGYDGKKHVSAGNGQMTATVRSALNFNNILGDGGVKTRDDHRHHAVDAVAIALTDASLVSALSSAAARSADERRIAHRDRRFGEFKTTWATVANDVDDAISKVIPSHDANRRVRGALHKETNYKVAAAGEKQDGFQVGSGERTRFVKTDSNHHMAIFERRTKNGAKWEFQTVSLLVATQRLTAQHKLFCEYKKQMPETDARERARLEKPVIVQTHSTYPDAKFVMALSPGDGVEMKVSEESVERKLFLTRGVNAVGRPQFGLISDAREKGAMDKKGANKSFVDPVLSTFRKLEPKKIVITPLGEIR